MWIFKLLFMAVFVLLSAKVASQDCWLHAAGQVVQKLVLQLEAFGFTAANG
jgi:hypothetical protein